MLVQLRRQADRVADRIPREAMIAGLEPIVLGTLALASARLIWTIVTPVGVFGDWRPVGGTRPGPDIASLGAFDPFFRTNGDDATTAISTLGLTLVGTRVDMVSGRGSAIIAVEDGKQSSFAVGEEIVPGVRLKSVAFDEVVLDRGGSAESLFLDQSSGSSPVTPESAGAVANIGKARLAADILITPRLRGTAITGYVLTPKGSGAAFEAAGLQTGDVLVSVDGAPVSGITDPASLARQLDAGGVTAGIERAGRTMNLRIGGSL